ncbi:hypothetical protein KAI52_01100 [Candidatus Parcubacteria bacterium]|nr:hypothetical protein [Candidatus Parcubacteria bacterium]
MSEKKENNTNFYDKIVNGIKCHKIISVLMLIFLLISFIFTLTTNFFDLNDRFGTKRNIDNSHSMPLDNITIKNQQAPTEKKLPPDFKRENPILIKLTYKPPKITEGDQCDESCVGIYIKIGQDDDFLYFDHPSCRSYRVVGYHYDSGNEGKKIISDWQVEEKITCNWISLQKYLILNMVNLSNSASTIKTIPNYKTME